MSQPVKAVSPIKAKQLYSALRQKLAPILKSNGYKTSKLSPLAWSKPHLEEHLSFWFQLDKHGWFDELGSSFTLEFQLGPDPHETAGWNQRLRYFSLLTPADQELLRMHNNQVCRNLPELDPNHLLYPSMKVLRAFDTYCQRDEPYAPKEDVWLRYYTMGDVDFLAEFFGQRMMVMLEAFLQSRP